MILETRTNPLPFQPSSTGACPISEDRWNAVGRSLRLTPRELQIVRELFAGLSEERIARDLNISPFTVHTHLGRLYRKLEVDSARRLLLRVFREILTLGS